MLARDTNLQSGFHQKRLMKSTSVGCMEWNDKLYKKSQEVCGYSKGSVHTMRIHHLKKKTKKTNGKIYCLQPKLHGFSSEPLSNLPENDWESEV